MASTILEMRTEKATHLKNIWLVLSNLFSKAHFQFSITGLKLKAMDTSGGAYVVLQLCSKAFDHYICNTDDLSTDDLSLCLNLNAMAMAFRFANSGDIVTIKYKSDDPLVFSILLSSPDNCVIKCFDLNLVAFKSVNVLEHPESMYQAIVRMPSAKFMHLCKVLICHTGDMETVVSISVDKDNVCFFTDNLPAIVCQQNQNDDKPNEATRIEMKEKISLTFGLRYLDYFSKASTLSDQVTIKLSSNLPAVFEYKIAKMGYIRYYMKPADKEAETQGISEEDKMQN